MKCSHLVQNEVDMGNIRFSTKYLLCVFPGLHIYHLRNCQNYLPWGETHKNTVKYVIM